MGPFQEIVLPSDLGQPFPSGHFTATLIGQRLYWRVSFKSLTSAALSVQIHAGRKGTAGPVLFALCYQCASPKSGVRVLNAAQIRELVAGRLYVNVHTRKNLNGEIRGQIHRVG
jgi:hypothetical protein